MIKSQHQRKRDIFTSYKHKDDFKIICNDLNSENSINSGYKNLLNFPKTENELIKKYSGY